MLVPLFEVPLIWAKANSESDREMSWNAPSVFLYGCNGTKQEVMPTQPKWSTWELARKPDLDDSNDYALINHLTNNLPNCRSSLSETTKRAGGANKRAKEGATITLFTGSRVACWVLTVPSPLGLASSHQSIMKSFAPFMNYTTWQRKYLSTCILKERYFDAVRVGRSSPNGFEEGIKDEVVSLWPPIKVSRKVHFRRDIWRQPEPGTLKLLASKILNSCPV